MIEISKDKKTKEVYISITKNVEPVELSKIHKKLLKDIVDCEKISLNISKEQPLDIYALQFLCALCKTCLSIKKKLEFCEADSDLYTKLFEEYGLNFSMIMNLPR